MRRLVDDELDELLPHLSAISLEGCRAVGKTTTAAQRARTVMRLDDPHVREVVAADPGRVIAAEPPVLIDEWQHLPSIWDAVRRAVDDGRSPGRFLLAGSASPTTPPMHSGAGRIVPVRIRPLTLPERGVESPSVSLGTLLTGTRPALRGSTAVDLTRYAEEICASGLPGIRTTAPRARRELLDGYLSLVVERDIEDAGVRVRNPRALERWMRAYAAATSTVASYETIRDAATAADGATPARSTAISYRAALERMWLLDPLSSWLPTTNALRRLTDAPKHHLADPALAARLLGASVESLLEARPIEPFIPRNGPLLGGLFESLATLSVRVFARANEASVGHLRTQRGEREVDLIVQRDDGRVVAIEVKLARTVDDGDVRHLRWLREQIGDRLLDAVVCTSGPEAYRRPDGIGVVPLALLGP